MFRRARRRNALRKTGHGRDGQGARAAPSGPTSGSPWVSQRLGRWRAKHRRRSHSPSRWLTEDGRPPCVHRRSSPAVGPTEGRSEGSAVWTWTSSDVQEGTYNRTGRGPGLPDTVDTWIGEAPGPWGALGSRSDGSGGSLFLEVNMLGSAPLRAPAALGTPPLACLGGNVRAWRGTFVARRLAVSFPRATAKKV